MRMTEECSCRPHEMTAMRGCDGIEEHGGRGRAAAVMRDFQHVRAEVPVSEPRFRFALDVACEQNGLPLDLHAEDDRGVVLRTSGGTCEARRGLRRGWRRS